MTSVDKDWKHPNADCATDTKAPRPNILREAEDIIYGDREKTYGDPSKNLLNIANFWSMYIRAKHSKIPWAKLELDIDDVCQMMILVKQARLINDPSHRDSKVDIAGYAALSDRCATQKDARYPPPQISNIQQEVPKRPAVANSQAIDSSKVYECVYNPSTGLFSPLDLSKIPKSLRNIV